MNFQLRFRYAAGLVLAGAMVGLIIDASRPGTSEYNPLQLVRRPASVQTRDDAALLSGWLEQVDNGWEVGKNHQQVRSAFKDVVAQARRSTVRVFRDDRQVALGTVIDADGLVLTKASEVTTSNGKLICQLVDRRKRPAEIVSSSLKLDLAVLKVAATNLVPVQWYQGEPPAVGSLLATPNLGREPLAIGVVSLRPKSVANNGVLGIRLRNTADGVFVAEVLPQSAAEIAGVHDGDMVLRVNDVAVGSSEELVDIVGEQLPGDVVALDVARGEETYLFHAKLGRRADLDQENLNFQSFLGGELSERRSGFKSVLQHDTFLLPEHCGGPIVDLEGHVIGINIARAERIASYALPSDQILPLLEELKNGKSDSLVVQRGTVATGTN